MCMSHVELELSLVFFYIYIEANNLLTYLCRSKDYIQFLKCYCKTYHQTVLNKSYTS